MITSYRPELARQNYDQYSRSSVIDRVEMTLKSSVCRLWGDLIQLLLASRALPGEHRPLR